MSETTEINDIEKDAQALFEALANGKPLPPDIAQRLRDRGARTSAEIRKRQGNLDVVVQLLRESRDE